jgi:hypothetical protein
VKRDVDAFLTRLWQLEDLLVANGFPAMPDWWRKEITRFYRSGKRRWVVRKGRRVFASTCIAPRLASAEMLYGQHPHLPGTPPHTYAFLSVKRDEASKRLRGVRAILDVLGEPYDERAETIELRNRPAVFAVVSANFRTSVGETVAYAWGDEVSRWRDDATGANPASEVIGSLSPALATLPDAKLFLVSSPLSVDDYHARSFDLGETEAQCVSFGATWEINPTLSEADCRKLESDPRIFDREYGGIPSAAVSPAFDPAHAIRSIRPLPPGCRFYPPIGTLDSAAGKSMGADRMAWGTFAIAELPAPPPYLYRDVPRRNHCVINGRDVVIDDPHETVSDYQRDEHGEPVRNPASLLPRVPVLAMTGIDSVSGVFHEGLVDGSLWNRIGRFFQGRGVRHVYGDGYGGPQTERELRRFGIKFHELKWTPETKGKAVYRLRHLMASDALFLPQHDQLRAELLSYQEKIAPSGAVQYAGRGATKDDHVAQLLCAAMVEHERQLPGSPLHIARTRHEQPLRGGGELIY